MNTLRTSLGRFFAEVSGRKLSLRGVSMMRIGYAIAALQIYLTNYNARDRIWGTQNVYPFDSYLTNTEYMPQAWAFRLGHSSSFLTMFLVLGALVATAMMLGFGGRLIVFVHFVFLSSLYQLNPMILDGGDNLAYVCLPFLVLAKSNAHYSVRYAVPSAIGRWMDQFRGHVGRTRPYDNLLHNFALIAIVFQIAVVYWSSAMYKVQGDFWQGGVAVYYIMRVPEFTWPGVSHFIYESAPAVFLLTYGTVWLQFALPPMLLTRRTREIILPIAIGFHLGILVFMNLWSFSIYMISTELAILPLGLTQLRRRVRSEQLAADVAREPIDGQESYGAVSPS